jgi:hypothetical protein
VIATTTTTAAAIGKARSGRMPREAGAGGASLTSPPNDEKSSLPAERVGTSSPAGTKKLSTATVTAALVITMTAVTISTVSRYTIAVKPGCGIISARVTSRSRWSESVQLATIANQDSSFSGVTLKKLIPIAVMNSGQTIKNTISRIPIWNRKSGMSGIDPSARMTVRIGASPRSGQR